MVLKRFWRFLKKAFRKKRKTFRKRRARKVLRKFSSKPRHKRKRGIVKPRKSKKRSNPARAKKAALKPVIRGKPSVKAVLVGTVTHYFPKVNAAVVKCKRSIRVGQPVLIKGQKTNLKQTVGSMQINRVGIEKAKAGQEIGLEVFKEVRPGDMVYLLEG